MEDSVLYAVLRWYRTKEYYHVKQADLSFILNIEDIEDPLCIFKVFTCQLVSIPKQGSWVCHVCSQITC